jgi:hypothetical protein
LYIVPPPEWLLLVAQRLVLISSNQRRCYHYPISLGQG